jgi:DNA-binding IclR family transcriptional regulator
LEVKEQQQEALESKDNKNSIPAVERAMDIMALLASHDEPISFEDLLKITGLPRSSVFRLLSTLEKTGFVEKTDKDGATKWKIGKLLIKIGLDELTKMDLRTEALPVMKWLSDEADEYVQLGVLFKGKVMYIEHIKRLKKLSMYAELGSLLHVNISAAGMVLTSHLSPTLIDKILQEDTLPQNTAKTITSPHRFKSYLATVQEQGYAVDDEMYAIGIRCIAAPVYDYAGNNVAAVGISGLAVNITEANVKEKAALVMEAAQRISKRLGY